jgi:predicted component of viral defense system (DUF524 family)
MTEIESAVRGIDGGEIARLRVCRLPGRSDLIALENERLVVEEEGIYVFQVDFPGENRIQVDPGGELFSFDDASNMRGRLLPKQHVGRINVAIRGSASHGLVTLSVRPRKLEQDTEYRRMLDDIAETATEAILQGFAPSTIALLHDAALDPRLLYQQFAFLHARLSTSGERDLAMIINRPHTGWVDFEETQSPGKPLRGTSRNLRAVTRPGRRTPTSTRHPVASLPDPLRVVRTEETLDTEPNRFVSFALRRWRDLAQRLLDILQMQVTTSGPVTRGIDAAEEVIALLDSALNAPMFREVGEIRSFPSGNQVLQKRAGYRELFRNFALAETGARLALDWDIEDVFGASQRNVATLYEYWAFLQLAKILGGVCGADLSAQTLQLSSDNLSLAFPQGKGSPLKWQTLVRGRSLTVTLYFNREFLVSALPDASWTRAMRPDCSVQIRADEHFTDVSSDELAIWLHFDAKYRVEYADRQFAALSRDQLDLAVDDEEIERLARSRREDLLKMHAYRDAIRRSAGAYVLYPGDHHQSPFTEHQEVLPSLGAFVLRPAEHETLGTSQLEQFLRDVLDHVADQATQHERSRFWRTVAYRGIPSPERADRRLPRLGRPPSDALVLCGYVRGAPHAAWIYRTGLYNVRAGDRPGAVALDSDVLHASDLVLYGRDIPPTLWSRVGTWFVQSREQLFALDYPSPGGKVYLCCPIERRDDEPEWLSGISDRLSDLSGKPRGTPFAASWQHLLRLAE